VYEKNSQMKTFLKNLLFIITMYQWIITSQLLAAKKLSLFCQPEKIPNFLLTDVNVAHNGEDLTHLFAYYTV
jgi:hypothetical protein